MCIWKPKVKQNIISEQKIHTSSFKEGWKFNFDFSKIKTTTKCNPFLGKKMNWFPLREPWKPSVWTSQWAPQTGGTLGVLQKSSPVCVSGLWFNFRGCRGTPGDASHGSVSSPACKAEQLQLLHPQPPDAPSTPTSAAPPRTQLCTLRFVQWFLTVE